MSDDPAKPSTPGCLDDLIDAIGTVGRMAADEVTSTVAGASEQVAPLVDQVQRAKVDELLEGDFESVAEVLGGVFEAHASAVERSAVDAQVMPDDAALPRDVPGRAVTGRSAGADARAMAPARDARSAAGSILNDLPNTSDRTAPLAAGGLRPGAAASTGRRLLRPLGPLSRAVLSRLATPVRLLPPPAREIVDWMAVSLVLWVLVVWVIVLLLTR